MLRRNAMIANAATASTAVAALSFSFCRSGKGDALAKSAGFSLVSAGRAWISRASGSGCASPVASYS